MANHQIFRNLFHQLHCNDWSIRGRKPIPTFRSRLGDLDTLHFKPTVKEKKGIGQGAVDSGNFG